MKNLKKLRQKLFWRGFIFLFLILLGAQLVITSFFRDKYWSTMVMMPIIFLLFIMMLFFLYRISLFYKEFCRLEEEDEKWSILMHVMPDFICYKDGKSRWKLVNDFGRKLYQLENIDYVGKTDLELGEINPFFKKDLGYCYISDEEAWSKRDLSRIEESFAVPSGEIKSFDVIKIPLFYSNGERKGLLTIGRDITQQKVAEAMLLKREKLSVVGELAAGIAHEIRNPLTSIKGLTQLMHESGEVTDEYVKVMISEIDRINQIASELLVLSKPQSREFVQVSLNDILRYVINILEPEALLKGVQMDFCKDEEIQLEGDHNSLVQVFINILKNSMDAMPNGGVIRITNKRDDHKANIIISDQGIGISPERLKRIGEPFFTLKEKGMGLGLTVSQKIIQDHKGTFEIQSEQGKGTDVVITLPTI